MTTFVNARNWSGFPKPLRDRKTILIFAHPAGGDDKRFEIEGSIVNPTAVWERKDDGVWKVLVVTDPTDAAARVALAPDKRQTTRARIVK